MKVKPIVWFNGDAIDATQAGVRVYFVNFLRCLADVNPDDLPFSVIVTLSHSVADHHHELYSRLSGSLGQSCVCVRKRFVDVIPGPLRSLLLPAPVGPGERISLCISFDYHGPVSMAFPTAVVVHDLKFRTRPSDQSFRSRLIRDLFFHLFSFTMPSYLCISASTLKEMEVHFPRMLERSRIVGSGTLKTPSLGFRPGDALGPILSVGTTNKNKNYPTLIRAYANSGVQNPLVIVGRRGDDFDAISSLLDSYKNLDVRILHGLTDVELDALYQDAALCVFVSHYEGYGIPVSEAIALGAPVICSNIPTFRDIAGNAAMYVDPYNLDGIADAIRSVLLNKEALEVMRYRSLQRAKIISFDAAFSKIIEFATDVAS